MTEYRGAWDAEGVADFLAETAVPMRLTTHRPDETLWTVALWYRYEDGTFACATGADADVVSFLRTDDRVAFDVSVNDPPYRGVRGNGVATVERDVGKSLLRSLLERYLGGTDSELARSLLADDREEARIEIHPEDVYSWDYTERMR
ncbi:pyridoxamine 5'-phosphate oxidase family protein [Halarchaeum sp. CBA1220]|uniref:pyridoxamine 5'-phosphate oxidase family protein n=1 Tax=Halarchaeum sp. CBA1220 TaxID=1853682 RepID=UPI000F3A8BD7|nr:pyridoxamine 5'-phosphate oxidase family protein [Halarchaeum sp. CBA1220]QLC32844.1 pyridoxamine 5'-phosphate oxidase family protein [Halarchaeum sp. CBA1220]